MKSTTPKSTTTVSTTITTTSTPTTTTTVQTTTRAPRPITTQSTVKPTPKTMTMATQGTTTTTTTTTTTSRPPTTTRRGNVVVSRTTVPPWRGNSNSQQRPPLVLGFPPNTGKHQEVQEVMVRSAYRQDNSVIIQWDSETANILGFRVVYRLFGDKSFKQGPPLEASEREFKIKNVPAQVSVMTTSCT